MKCDVIENVVFKCDSLDFVFDFVNFNVFVDGVIMIFIEEVEDDEE